MPATVDTSTTTWYNINWGYQRKCFHAEGLFWAFYSDGINAGWKTSADGVDWSGAFTSIGACIFGDDFSVWFDEATGFVHYARLDYGGTYDLFYRRGAVVNDGSINWSAVEQTVHNGSAGNIYGAPCIAVDTNGYAWIGAHNQGTPDKPRVLKNANNDGTWAEDFDYELNAVDDPGWQVCPVPLTGGKVYVVYCKTIGTPLGKLYDTGWGAEESDLGDYQTCYSYGFSAVAIGDNVHFVYIRFSPYQIRHNERVWSVGWNENCTLVQDAVTIDTGPALSADPSCGNLYCFWVLSGTDHVYYKKYDSGWDAEATDWIDESIDDIKTDDLVSSFYMDYGGYVGLLYSTGLYTTWNVRFAFLTMPPPPTTSKISGVTDPAAVAGVSAANIAKVMGIEFVTP